MQEIEPKKKNRVKKVISDFIQIGLRTYKKMRTGAIICLNPPESRRARHKKQVLIRRHAIYGMRAEKSLMRRLRQNMDDYLRAQARLKERASIRVTSHPKERRRLSKVLSQSTSGKKRKNVLA